VLQWKLGGANNAIGFQKKLLFFFHCFIVSVCKRRTIVTRIRPQKFVHVVYRTHRFDEMMAWYQFVFDAKVQYQNPVLAFLTYEDEHHRFALVNLDVVQPDSAETERQGLVGVDHVAYTYGSLEDLFENYQQLGAEEIKPYWCVHHGMTVSMYYADPDGNQMEFQVDVFDSRCTGRVAVGLLRLRC
jgi:catechol-2,3-dioxygenase